MYCCLPCIGTYATINSVSSIYLCRMWNTKWVLHTCTGVSYVCLSCCNENLWFFVERAGICMAWNSIADLSLFRRTSLSGMKKKRRSGIRNVEAGASPMGYCWYSLSGVDCEDHCKQCDTSCCGKTICCCSRKVRLRRLQRTEIRDNAQSWFIVMFSRCRSCFEAAVVCERMRRAKSCGAVLF